MEWPDDLAADLPGPNPDEPQSLRQDILDELRDHLQSSLELEQLKGTPASEAERAVITKFGNPVQTARQLWWDAMKGRIMSQRITLGLVIVLCLLSVAATAMLWQTVQQGQQTTAALIAKLEDIANRPPAADVPAPAPEPQYFDWVPVTVVLKDEQGQPVTGDDWKVSISGDLYRDGESSSHSTRPDQDGLCDFGPVRLGTMNFHFEGPEFSTRKTQSVRPGKPFQLDLTVPTGERETVEQSLSVNWPEEIRNESLWTHLVLAYQPIKVEGRNWMWESRVIPTTFYSDNYVNNLRGSSSEAYRGPDSLPAGLSVLISPDGKLFVGELEPEELYVVNSTQERSGGRVHTNYSTLFSHDFFQKYQSPYHRIKQARRSSDGIAGGIPSGIQKESYLELFPLVHFRETADTEEKLDETGKLWLPREGIWVHVMSVIAPVDDDDVTGPANGFSGRVVSVSSRPLNYWGVGGDSNGAGFYNADAIQASPLAEMLSFDEEQNSWKFVPSQEIVTQLQNNLAELRRSLEARRNKKPEETGSDAPAESPKPPESD